MTFEQATLVGMRESKGVRRAVLHKLKELESAQHRPLPPPPLTMVLPPPPPLPKPKAPTKAQLVQEAAQRTRRMQQEQHLLARRKVAQLELDIARIDMQLLSLTSH